MNLYRCEWENFGQMRKYGIIKWGGAIGNNTIWGTTSWETHGKPEEHHWEHMRTWWEHKKNYFKNFKFKKIPSSLTLATKGRKDETSWIECMFGSSHCLYMHISLTLDKIAIIYLFIYFCLKLIPLQQSTPP